MVTTGPSGARPAAAALIIIAAIAAAYHNSLEGPFVFDDTAAILENPTIRQLWPLSDVILPPRGEGLTVEGRPVLNLSLAINYAIGGTAVRGYHLFNLGVHALAALALFGVVRHSLLLPRLRARFGEASLALAFLVALLWSLHPLQTAAVTYVIQRAESLVGLFYLLTLYCFLRVVGQVSNLKSGKNPDTSETCPTTSRRVVPWSALTVFACLIGMATKEVMVSAPLMVVLFDRALVAGTWREAWRQRGRLHGALFATWLLLGLLVISSGTRGGTAGFGINVTPWTYALTQFEAVTRYVGLSFWPHPLVFDYGVAWVQQAADVLPYAIGLLTLMAGTIVAWRRWPAAAWLALLFFAVLAPTSSIVPGNRQTLAEHRMYLPLAAVIGLAASSVFLVTRASRARRWAGAAALSAALAFGLLTTRRNLDYRTELALYSDTTIKRPGNGFARYNYGKALAESGRHAEALPEYDAALRLMPGAPGFHYNRANSLAALGRRDEAIAGYQAALKLEPRYPRAHFNLGNELVAAGRKTEAAVHFAQAIDIDPAFIEARANLGGVLLDLGRLAEARKHFEHVLQADPRHVIALFNLGNVCMLERRWADAIRHFETVVALQPDLAVARERLALARANLR